jgi:O-acetyl-ADP-ribose deacetylase (regulator of RNase III)
MIEIRETDITTLSVDAIVNAANETLLGGGGVDGAIHRAAGPELLDHCRGLGGCRTGSARISPGFSLSARFVIHAVGPVWKGGQSGEAQQLRSCYLESFRLAEERRIKSIAFPAISAGVYGYPSIEAASIATQTMLENESKFDVIIACCFNAADVAVYEIALGRKTPAPSD